MQNNTQELVDSKLLDTLKSNYYFELEEKFRLYQRANFLFVLLIPMSAILLRLLDHSEENQLPLEILFIFCLTCVLICSIYFLAKSFTFNCYSYAAFSEEILEYKIKLQESGSFNEQKFTDFLNKQYANAATQNAKVNEKRATDLLIANACGTGFAALVLISFIYNFYIKEDKIIVLYKYLASFINL